MKAIPAILFAAVLFLASAAARSQPVETELAGVTAEVLELRQSGGLLRLAVRFANGGARRRISGGTGWSDRARRREVQEEALPTQGREWAIHRGPDRRLDRRRAHRAQDPAKAIHGAVGVLRAGGPGKRDERRSAVSVPVRQCAGDGGNGQGLRERHRRDHARRGAGNDRLGERADQVLNVRLRLAAERGQKVDLLSPYFMFRMSSSSTRSRSASIRAQGQRGNFQGQPLTVKIEGGRFILDWGKQRSSASPSRRRPIRCSGPISSCPSSCPSKP